MVNEGGRVYDFHARVVYLMDSYMLLMLEGDAGMVNLMDNRVLLVEERWWWDKVERCHGFERCL